MIRHYVWPAAVFLGLSVCLEVAPNSPCGKKCIDDPKNGNPAWGNASMTFGPDLPCLDSDYMGKNATKEGKKLSDCQTCMQSSGWEDAESGERDTTWFMFNLRGAADYCLFGRFGEEHNDDISSTEPYKQCYSACNPIYAASDYRVKSDPERYDYCDSNGNYTSDAQNCIKCLYDGDNMTILGNVVATLTELCNTKPGKNIKFDEDIFNTTRIELPSAVSTTSTSSTQSSSNSASNSPSSDSNSNSGLSTGALAGIVLGGLVAVAAVLAGILLLLRRAKKRREVNTGDAASGQAFIAPPAPDVSSYYASGNEHKYMHYGEPTTTGPISELPPENVQELMGPSSPVEIGVGQPTTRK